MATDYSRRKSFLTLTPVDFSLTAGTSIPAPPDTPPRSPSPVVVARPPTAGGGPLSSHPPSAEDIHSAAALPPTPDPESEVLSKMPSSTSSNHDMDRTDSFRTPASPASAHQKPLKSEQQKHGQSVRKLFSLGNLRNSFSSSRTSLHTKSPSAETSPQQPQSDSFRRPASSQTIQPQMRPRTKSGSWFKRKSGLFMLNDTEELSAVAEDRPVARENMKSISKHDISAPVQEVHKPAPLLPEIGGLGNGNTNGGDLGWDEGMFKR